MLNPNYAGAMGLILLGLGSIGGAFYFAHRDRSHSPQTTGTGPFSQCQPAVMFTDMAGGVSLFAEAFSYYSSALQLAPMATEFTSDGLDHTLLEFDQIRNTSSADSSTSPIKRGGPRISPIAYAIAVVSAAELLTGLDMPYNGEDLDQSSTRLTELCSFLQSATPDSGWQGTAASSYLRRTTTLQDATQTVTDTDAEFVVALQSCANYVLGARSAFGLIKALLILAYVIECLCYDDPYIQKCAFAAAALGSVATSGIALLYGVYFAGELETALHHVGKKYSAGGAANSSAITQPTTDPAVSATGNADTQVSFAAANNGISAGSAPVLRSVTAVLDATTPAGLFSMTPWRMPASASLVPPPRQTAPYRENKPTPPPKIEASRNDEVHLWATAPTAETAPSHDIRFQADRVVAPVATR